jgi:WhiB family redox-sensing transcriptional regulator
VTKKASPSPDWRKRACAFVLDPDIFFPGDDKIKDVPEIAASYCRRCEISRECLEWALDNAPYGVWGNTTGEQRKRLKRNLTRVHCPGCGSLEIIEERGGEVCLSCGLSWLA